MPFPVFIYSNLENALIGVTCVMCSLLNILLWSWSWNILQMVRLGHMFTPMTGEEPWVIVNDSTLCPEDE